MMRRAGMVLVLGMLASGCGDAFSSRVGVVARVGPYELGVDRLAGLLAEGKGIPLEREVAEGVAILWVDFTIFADRIVSGDSLTDWGYVAAAMWAEIQQEFADRYHAQLVGDAVDLDSAQVDSAYAAGQYRFIKHILFAVDPNAAPNIRQAKRRLAYDTQARLKLGGLTWEQAAEANEDPGTQDTDGSLGVIGYGEMVPAFENAAYALSPGEISPVTETAYGYHILRRPALAEVREEFQKGVEQRGEDAFDDAFLEALPERWDIKVRSGIAPAVRELGHDPIRAKRSGKVLGTYKGGRFLVSDFARWVQAMPQQVRQQMASASDSQVTMLVSSLMRNEALVREAREAGAEITPEFQEEMADQLRRQLSLVAALVGFPLDTLPLLRGLPKEALQDTVTVRVFEYLQLVALNKKRLQTVPPFLADTLRAESDWEISAAGIEQVLDRARQLRLGMNGAPAQGGRPPADTTAPPPAKPDAQ
ncbi:MAG: peptidylprolyl isomerase [Gemmatimonadota bacterium]|nr:peptidylprolyl isomerase [Gemmatimonadota bacterium]